MYRSERSTTTRRVRPGGGPDEPLPLLSEAGQLWHRIVEAIRADGAGFPNPLRRAGLDERIAPFVVIGMLSLLLLTRSGNAPGAGPVTVTTVLLLTLTLAYAGLQVTSQARSLKMLLPPLACWLAFWPELVQARSSALTAVSLSVVSLGWVSLQLVPWDRLPRSAGGVLDLLAIAALYLLVWHGTESIVIFYVLGLVIVLWLALNDTVAKLAIGIVMVAALLALANVANGEDLRNVAGSLLFSVVAAVFGLFVQHQVRGGAGERQVLQIERDRLQAVINEVPVVLFAVDQEGSLTLAEGHGLQLLGSRPRDHLGERLSDLLPGHPEISDGVRIALSGTAVTRMSQTTAGRSVQTHLTPVRNDAGRVTGVRGVAVDVTTDVEAAAARTETDAKSEAIRVLSHEIRNPLNSIIGYAELLGTTHSSGLDDRQKRFVFNIRSAGEELLTLTNNSLDLSKLAAGKLELEMQTIPLEAILAQAADQARVTAERLGLELVLEAEPDLQVKADRHRLLQVLANLLSNAIKNTPEGGQIVLSSARSGATVQISVSDSGVGIPSEQLERIFQEFVQVGTARAGNGLGLAISRRLVEAMGGHIFVTSELGAGSRFTIEMAEVAARQPAVTNARPLQPEGDFVKLAVLK